MDDNIKPSKADTAAGRNNPVVYSCDFGGKRQSEPISFKPKLLSTPQTISQCRLATVRYGYEKGLSISGSFSISLRCNSFSAQQMCRCLSQYCKSFRTACVGLITRNNCWYAGAEKVLILQKRYPQQISSCIRSQGAPGIMPRG